ncbi:MAG: sensor histidine kinase [Myxococcota bacterium]|nr:sensor histidine kinase [Myxococcota bacterium]
MSELAHSGVGASSDAPPRFVGAGTIVATAVVVALAVIAGAPGSSAAALTMLATLSAAYLGLATAGMAWAERSSARRIAVVLALQVPLVCGALALSEGRAFLIAMPLVSMAVLFLPARAVLSLVATLVVVFGAIVARAHAAPVALQAGVGFASAAGFVAVFSQLVRRERTARGEVERLLRDLRAANAQLADYVTQVGELATTKERNRIAREVHDGLGHTLTVASMQLEAARTQSADAAVNERMERVQQILRDGLGELRRSVAMLRVVPSSPQAFAKAIAELTRSTSASGLDVELVSEGAPRPLPGAVGFTLYRAAQEALTNTRRHAGASAATVRLVYGERTVALCIEDDGVGAGELAIGHGLAGLRERVELVGGSMEIDTAAGRGLRVRIEVPG